VRGDGLGHVRSVEAGQVSSTLGKRICNFSFLGKSHGDDEQGEGGEGGGGRGRSQRGLLFDSEGQLLQIVDINCL
jgi:hypothetical protein